MNSSMDATTLNVQVQHDLHICPACGASNALDTLSKHEYRCEQCNLELAHLDMAANGVIRGIFGWLHTEGDMIEGRYRVKSVLGKGGFGVTYLVEDNRLNGKRRALKEVPELLFDEYETTLLSQLNHPSIPDIIDRSIADGMVYLVLEFGGSQTLGSERKQHQGRIPLAKLLLWMRQLCEVLIYLHSQDPPIIHRDLKPDNILLDENGRIMLIDFGIAKEATPATMTRTIGRAATHGFSPPEQAMGTGTDERSDIYSLAATFYALLTGKNPPAAHERVSGKEIIPPSQFVPDISSQLEATLLQALSLNVNHRQQTVKEFSQTLDMIASGTNNTSFTTEYSERTVMISKTIGVTDTTGIHPASIKLPSGRISIEKSNTLSTPVPAAQQHSKRNVIILLSVIFIIFAVLLAVYLFWIKTPTETKEAVIIVPTSDVSGVNTTPVERKVSENTPPTSMSPVKPPTVVTTPVVPSTKEPATSPETKETATPTTVPSVNTIPMETKVPENKPPIDRAAAAKALAKAFEEKGNEVPETSPIKKMDSSADKSKRKAIEEEKRRSDEHKRKQQQALANQEREIYVQPTPHIRLPPPPKPPVSEKDQWGGITPIQRR